MKDDAIRKAVLEWVERDEKHNVLAALIKRRVSASMADQLVRGKYPTEPHGVAKTVILDELVKAGLPFDEDKVS